MEGKRLIARISDIQEIEGCSYPQAQRIFRTIKDSYGKDKINLYDLSEYYQTHVINICQYLSLPIISNIAS